jgi:hypothetical protein
MNSFYLSITSLLLLFPIIIFKHNNNQTIYKKILVLLLLINIMLSFLFWINPIENSILHYYDGIFAKISYIVFIIYILFVKKINYKIKLIFIIILFVASFMFYYSNINSKKIWCSKKHIIIHSIFHFLASIGCFFAFI